MPKMKSNKSAAKRFRKTKSGKFKHMKANAQHHFHQKTRQRKRQLRSPGIVAASDAPSIKSLLPYA
jgi:large subunit ribosomal protein L35